MGRTICLLLFTLLFLGGPAAAPPPPRPQYLKLKVGDTVEVKGNWDRKQQIFVASEIEKLPAPRRPKLRGPIGKILLADKSFVLFGKKISTDTRTEFLDSGSQKVHFADLKASQRVEVTCNPDEKGNWTARKIAVEKVKPTDKIKATVTRLAFTGTPPDTFEVSGLKILVGAGTEMFGPWPEK